MKSKPRDMTPDELIVHYEPVLTRAQFRAACRRLENELDKTIARDGCQSARYLIEKIHLIAGNRRVQAVAVKVERRSGS